MTRLLLAKITFALLAYSHLPAYAGPSTSSMEQIDSMRSAAGKSANGYLEGREAFATFIESLGQTFDAASEPIEANGVPGLWIYHSDKKERSANVILYIHGGGFYSGSSETHKYLGEALAKSAATDVVAIDYRRMPEHVYPSQIQDAVMSFSWLVEQGYEPERISIAGDSAGGNIVLEAALYLRDRGMGRPASLVMLSPIADLNATGQSAEENASRDKLLTRNGILKVTETYMAGKDPASPDASPINAQLTDLPPIFMQVGAGELLLDDTLSIARNAATADVSVTLEVWPHVTHQWQLYPQLLPEAKDSIDSIGRFVSAHFSH